MLSNCLAAHIVKRQTDVSGGSGNFNGNLNNGSGKTMQSSLVILKSSLNYYINILNYIYNYSKTILQVPLQYYNVQLILCYYCEYVHRYTIV